MVHWMVGARPEIGTHWSRSFPSFASGPVPRCGKYSILSGSKAYTCSLIILLRFTRASFLLPFLLTRRGLDPHKGGGSRLNISAIGGNFAHIRSPILLHPGWSCWVNCDLVRSCRVIKSPFVTVFTYGLTGHTLAKYPTKRLPKARSIKGMAIGMGASWHRKMSRPNELVGTRNVRKSERKE